MICHKPAVNINDLIFNFESSHFKYIKEVKDRAVRVQEFSREREREGERD